MDAVLLGLTIFQKKGQILNIFKLLFFQFVSRIRKKNVLKNQVFLFLFSTDSNTRRSKCSVDLQENQLKAGGATNVRK